MGGGGAPQNWTVRAELLKELKLNLYDKQHNTPGLKKNYDPQWTKFLNINEMDRTYQQNAMKHTSQANKLQIAGYKKWIEVFYENKTDQ
jgi:hypothetical protein